MLSRLAIVMIALAALTAGVGLQAQDAPPTSAQIKENLALKEQILQRQYQEFEQQLLRLKQRLERSNKQEERDQALVLDRVLEFCKDKSLSVQFEQMVDILKSKELKSLPDIEAAMNRSKGIAQDLASVIEMLREDSKAKSARDEILRLQEILKQLDSVIQNQKTVQAQTENNKTDSKELKKIQESVSQKTIEIAQKLGGKGGSEKDKNAKGSPKTAGKNGETAGEAKGDGEKKPEPAQAKEGPKPGENPKGEPKSGEPAQAKSGEKSPSQAKSGEPGKGQPKESKGGEPSQAKSGSGKPSESSPSKSKQGQAKSGEKKDGQSQAKNDNPTQPNSTTQSKATPKAANKGGEKQAPPGQPKENPQVGKKQVEEGYDRQQQAEAKIEEKKNEEASNKQTEAIQKLEQAKKELEKLLRQLREEEMERILAALQARCEKMLAMQIQVLAGTEGVDKAIAVLADKQPDRANKQESLKLSDSEGDIVLEATKAIEILEAEGSAIAFPEVFQQVREDMKHVQRRLGITDVGQVTQAIEKDIIDSLKEMIEALKKQRKELSDSKSKSEGSPPPSDQKLLEKIAELKMIRSMQIRVNTRTQTYGRMYPGEQAVDPTIRRELHNLSERQERIFEVTNRMAKGDSR